VSDVAAITMFGAIGIAAVTVAAAIAAISSSNSSVLAASRVVFAMGRDGLMSERLNVTHDRFNTPHRAIAATGAVTGLLVLAGLRVEEIVALLAQVASFSFLVTYGLVHVSLVVFRRADPDEYDPDFKLPNWAYPAVPLIGAASCLAVVTFMRPLVLLIGTGVIGVGILWYLAYARSHAPDKNLVGEAIAGVPKTVSSDGRYRVVVPVANPNTQRHLLRLAAATAASHDDAELVVVNVIEVPQQTALTQGVKYEEERLNRQQELLANVRDYANELGVGVRTRAIVGRDVWRVVLNVTKEEHAQEVILGWTGERKRLGAVLGSNIDQIVRNAECEVTLIKTGPNEVGNAVALVGEGPNASLGARRAYEFVQYADGASLTLANVQPPDDEAEATGAAIIDRVAANAGIEGYDTNVVISDDVRNALLDLASEYDTICIGSTRSTAVTQALFGSIPEEIGANVDGTVVITSGHQYKPRTISEAIIERLSA